MRKRFIVIKTVLYLADILLIIGFQTSVLPRLGLGRLSPQLTVWLAASAAVFDGAGAGGLVGLVCGLFTDALCGSTLLYHTLFLSVCFAIVGYVSPNIFRRRVLTALGWGVVADVAIQGCRFVFTLYLFNRAPLSELFTVVMPSVGVGAVMAIPVGEDTGVEMHDGFDQMVRVEEGNAVIEMGRMPGALSYKEKLSPCFCAIIPAGTYHIIRNAGGEVLRLSSVYAPPAHKWGTIDKTNPEMNKM